MGMAEGQPGVDKRQYARETGQAIQGIAAYYDATGNKEALSLAIAAADWALRERAMTGGGFRHSDHDTGGPYLADTVEMGAALLALHRSTGERKWLAMAMAAGNFVAATFIDPRTGGFFASASPDARHLPKPIKQREDNVTTTRFFTLLASYSGEARYREIAEAGMGYLASPAVLDAYAFLPDVLLAEEELRNEPVHVTVVGAKADPRSAALYAGALAYPLGLQARGMVGQGRRQARQSRRRLSGLSRGPGGLRLHAQFLLAAGDRRRGNPGADRPAAAGFAEVGPIQLADPTPHAEERAQRASRSMAAARCGLPSSRAPADRPVRWLPASQSRRGYAVSSR